MAFALRSISVITRVQRIPKHIDDDRPTAEVTRITGSDIPHSGVWDDNNHDTYAGLHDLGDALRVYAKMHIENVLKETSGNRVVAAKMMGLSRSSLYRKLESLGIGKDGEENNGSPL